MCRTEIVKVQLWCDPCRPVGGMYVQMHLFEGTLHGRAFWGRTSVTSLT